MIPKFFFIFSIISAIILTHSHSRCLDDQKTFLLELKKELVFNSSISTKLIQWNQKDDCCNWYGMECDGTGKVISLQLDGEAISGGIGGSSSLFKLKYLEKLNLAYNRFNSSEIPRGIHNLNYLTHLNLSNAGFSRQVPSEILSLRRLVSLDISNIYWLNKPLKLENPNLEMLVRNRTELRELYLDGVNITSPDERRKWSYIISTYLPDIRSLSMRSCSLSGPLARSFWQLHSLSILRLDNNDLSTTAAHLFANFSNLATLSLVGCDLNGSFSNTIFHIPTLQNLDLSWNKLISGSIPPFIENGSLRSIVLSRTNFSGSIPSSISNLKTLSHVDLSNCRFTGSIPSTFTNLTRLIYVDLSYNFFTGSLPSTLFKGASNLIYLNLGYNSFIGSIPMFIIGLPSLEELWLDNNQFTGQVEEFPNINVSNIALLDLSNNRLEGPIPDSFFKFESLESLSLSKNLFSGSFQLNKIQSLTNLTSLDLSLNNLSVIVGNHNSSIDGLPQLKALRLASCNLSKFPDIIKHSDMRVLDISNNRIAGEIPSWIWEKQFLELNLSLNLLTHMQEPYQIPPILQWLDMHSNQVEGELHLLIPPNIGNQTYNLRYLLLGNNKLSGQIPSSLCSAKSLDVLDLSVNRLNGNIPPCLLETTNILTVLDLGRNNISGRIPDNISLYRRLQYLDLNNNTLEGKIPKSLENCKWLEFMNVGNNNINDTFPCMLSSSLRVLVLRSNRFHGEVTCQKSWPDLQILDISSNNFTGNIELFNFSGWRAMLGGMNVQSRHNRTASNFLGFPIYQVGVRLTMKGQEVEVVKIWPDFTAIDLSCNNFGGEIPNAIGDLSSLRLLNISHNALDQSIPRSLGRLRDLESLDLSGNQLTGGIPMELARLTFLSTLNLSYNKLIGEIPNGPQFQTFSTDSFRGNPGLCGSNLNISCRETDLSPPKDEDVEERKREIEWAYVFAALGYVVSSGSFVWLLLFRPSYREKYFGKIDEVVEEILDAKDRTRRKLARRVVRGLS